MNYGKIIYCDIANGPGCRTSLFVSGCRHHCKGCFNAVAWPFDYGEIYTKEIENNIIESLRPDYIAGLTILGGEPFEPENLKEVASLIKKIKKEFKNKDIWVYSGFRLEELTGKEQSRCRESVEDCTIVDYILGNIDVLVDGKFEEDKKNISLEFRGSENQRIIQFGKSQH